MTLTTEHQARASLTAVAPSNIELWVGRAEWMMQLIDMVYESDLVPAQYRGSRTERYSEQKVKANLLAAGLLGDSMGVDPFQAWSNIFPTQAGKLGLAADFKVALCQGKGHDIETVAREKDTCTVRGRRRGSDTWIEVTITADDARAAGWTRNPVYGTPQGMSDMLYHRTSGRVADMVGADVVHGLATIDDLDDIDPVFPAVAASPVPVERPSVGDTMRASLVGDLIRQHEQRPDPNGVEAARAAIAEASIVTDAIAGGWAASDIEDGIAAAEVEADAYDEAAAEAEVEEDPGITSSTWAKINELFKSHGITGPGQTEARLRVIRQVIGRGIERGGEMATWEGVMVLSYLNRSGSDDVQKIAYMQEGEQ